MAKLNRLTAKIFGETASTTNTPKEIGQFGSAKAGTYNATGDVATIQSLSAWSNGWIDAVTPTDQFPPLPEMTGVHKVLSYQNAYLLQQGIPEWDSATTYYENGFCTYNGIIYKSILDENINNQPDETPGAWFEYGSGDYANQDINNLTTLGNARLQYAPFAINAGTVLNGENNTLTSGSFIESYSTPGTYTLEITEAGNYEVEMYGAGGGWDYFYYDSQSQVATGGSGAGYKGVITLPVGTYTVTVGAKGGTGGNTSLDTLIAVGGGTGGRTGGSAYSGWATAGVGGTVTIDASAVIVSTSLNVSGNNGTTQHFSSYTVGSLHGGRSVYDNTYTGYGTGGGSANANQDGFFGIKKVSGSASTLGCASCTITTCDGRTKVNSVATSYSIDSRLVELPFVQPTLTANGALGGASFAVSAKNERSNHPAYQAINGGEWVGIGDSSSTSTWYTFYNPTPLKVTQVTWVNENTAYYNLIAGTFEGSNDNSNWTVLGQIDNNNTANATRTITISSPDFYNYYRWNVTNISASGGDTSNGSMKNIQITAVYMGNIADGDYYIFKDYTDDSLSLISTLIISKTVPLTPSNNDYWLDISITPANLKVYDTSEWTINNDLVYIGNCTVSSGVITSLTNRPFNACPYHRDLVDSYINGTSWYAIYSDNWCEQGGQFTATTDTYNLAFLKAFKDTNYTILTNSLANTTAAYFTCKIQSKSTDSAYIFPNYGQAGYVATIWTASGYIA